jgi:hypothetical protein
LGCGGNLVFVQAHHLLPEAVETALKVVTFGGKVVPTYCKPTTGLSSTTKQLTRIGGRW